MIDEGGRPFGCVVVDRASGEVVHEATNQVEQSGDVYVTAYPCPMCLGALYYAAPEQVFYAVTREEEGAEYEDGGRYMTLATFYDEVAAPAERQSLPSTRVDTDDPTEPFRLWTSREAT